MSTKLHTCPSCGSSQPTEDADFCLRCRFPMMLIAGKYRLEKLLAEGGQGMVYLARHIHLDRDPLRVIKVVKQELFEQMPTLAARFRREVQVTSALAQRCQHIIKIYDDFGTIPSLGRFYVMEYLEGKSLSQWLHGPDQLPEIRTCLHIFHQLCDAMRYAHKEGIIHRDLKPDNIMLIDYEDEPLFLKVLDFGIARPTKEKGDKEQQITQGAIGTPEYMAPEQITGQPVDARADIYAMGVILFELLTGQTPHKANGTGQEAFFELVMKRMMEEPPLPSTLRPDRMIPKALEDVVMRAMSKAPNQRYDDVIQLKDAVRDAGRSARRNVDTILEDTTPSLDTSSPQDVSPMFTMDSTHIVSLDALPGNDEMDVDTSISFPSHVESSSHLESIQPTRSSTEELIQHVPSVYAEQELVYTSTPNPPTSEASMDFLATQAMSFDSFEHPETVHSGFQGEESEEYDSETVIAHAAPPPTHVHMAHSEGPSTPQQQTSSKVKLWFSIGSVFILILVSVLIWKRSFQSPQPSTKQKSIVAHVQTPIVRTRPTVRHKTTKIIHAPHIRPKKLQNKIKRTIRKKIKRSSKRRARKRLRSVIQRGPCPASTSNRHWIQLALTPRAAVVRYRGRNIRSFTKQSARVRSHVCIGFSARRAQLVIAYPQHRLCIIPISRSTKRLKVVLDRKREFEFGTNEYCKKAW